MVNIKVQPDCRNSYDPSIDAKVSKPDSCTGWSARELSAESPSGTLTELQMLKLICILKLNYALSDEKYSIHGGNECSADCGNLRGCIFKESLC